LDLRVGQILEVSVGVLNGDPMMGIDDGMKRGDWGGRGMSVQVRVAML
jgi:hypothetical protein